MMAIFQMIFAYYYVIMNSLRNIFRLVFRNGSVIVDFRLLFSDFISATPLDDNVDRKVTFDVDDVRTVLLGELPDPGEPPVNITLGRFKTDSAQINVKPGQ